MEGEVIVPFEVKRDRALRGHAGIKKRRPVESDDLLTEDSTGKDRLSLPVVQEGLSILDPKRESFEERSERFREQRKKYAAMHAHMEMAALVLATGGTFRLAAAKAGVSVRQVKKYYTDPDFRTRIQELRDTMLSKVKGRLYKELERRTRPGTIEHIELLDLLRVFDRVAGPVGGKGGVQVAGDLNVTQQNADTIIAALLAPESEGESEDFQIYEPSSFAAPSGDSPE